MMKLFSQDLIKYTGPLSPGVQQAIVEIQQYFGLESPEVLLFDKWHIAVPVNYKVSLPTNGAVNGIDIRETEPVMIKISLADYPNLAPFILSDRRDFPKANLSHLYFTEPEFPARFCLVRNDPNEWFATVKLVDFLDVGGQWLYKAGTGQLNGDGAEFDPTRLEGNVHGKHIYKYDILNEVVVKDERLIPDYPMAVCVAGQFVSKANTIHYKTLNPVPFIALKTVSDAIQESYVKAQTDNTAISPLFSILLWHPDGKTEDLYLTSMPNNYGQLKLFFSIRGISLQPILGLMETHSLLFKCGIPIIYAMKRPQKMIGYNGEYEFFNFILTMPKEGVNALTDENLVEIQGHIEPFSTELAKYISGQPRPFSTLYIGAGSLGSKMILHDGRSGNRFIGVADNDSLLIHNLVRHELFAGDVGQNKAKAIVEQLKLFYAVDNTDHIKAYAKSVVLMNAEFAEYQLLVDTTASAQVKNYLVLHTLPVGIRYCKAEIADVGELGLFYAEGVNRNPRMDDLVNLTCFLATQNSALQKWREGDANREIDTLNIGLGCSSATTVMADDIISFHASVFSRIMANLIHPTIPDDKGMIALNVIQNSNAMPQISAQLIEVAPFELFDCQQGSGWQLRFSSGISAKLFALLKKYKPIETGGVLVGIASYKTKVIHVFDIITEPQDSKGSCNGFTRGTKGLPAAIDQIKLETGDVIGYVGEWHTHPMDLRRLSTRDLETIEELKVLNAKTPIPTCAVIVTPKSILGFVFE